MTVDASRVTALSRYRVAARERLIVALDFPSLAEAAEMVGRLAPVVSWFKVGSELFTAAGPDAVAMVRAYGGKVFLDLKYHDIPNTVHRAVAAAGRLGVVMLNVHIAGGEAVLRAAIEASQSLSGPRPLVLGVTVLTSDETDVGAVVKSARLARACGLHGVIASAREAAAIKKACGEEFIVVTPGIRPSGWPGDDQRRTTTPAAAIREGSDYLVVGRPITAETDPRFAAETVLADIESAPRADSWRAR
ncbi:MAG: orotidine-5'-phosphate decarboxylase [Armatimonadetes bacterium]|nr:orotidine-5'-phosphate decarboxylase [Armatimonadota bacterium]